MKTSNIILVSLLGSITMIILMSMSEFLIKGNPRNMRSFNHPPLFDEERIMLPSFNYLQINNVGHSITVRFTDEASALLLTQKGQPKTRLAYHIQHDTLFVDSLQLHDKHSFFVQLTLNVPQSKVMGVGAKGANLTLEGIGSRELTLSLDNTRATLRGEWQVSANPDHVDTGKKFEVDMLHVYGTQNARIDIQSGIVLSTLDVQLDNTELFVTPSVHRLQGTVKNNSLLQFSMIEDFAFQLDNTSRLYDTN